VFLFKIRSEILFEEIQNLFKLENLVGRNAQSKMTPRFSLRGASLFLIIGMHTSKGEINCIFY